MITEKELAFICWHCQKETTVIVSVTNSIATRSQSVPVLHYCQHCNLANKILVPDNVDVHKFNLGKDKSFVGYTGSGIPILQGENGL